MDTVPIPADARRSSSWITTLVVSIALLILIVAGLVFIYLRFGTFLTATSDVRSFTFIDQGYAQPGPSSVGFFGMTRPDWAEPFAAHGTVIDVAQAPGIRAALVRPDGARTVAGVFLENTADGTVRALVMPTSELRAITLSSDGAYLAYSTFVPQRPNVSFSTSLGSWRTDVIELSTGTSFPLGEGFGASFVGGSRIFLNTSDGLASVDYLTGERVIEESIRPASITDAAVASPDGMYLVTRSKETGLRMLFAVESTDPIRLAPVRSFAGLSLSAPFFRGGEVFFLESASEGERLVGYALAAEGEPRTLFILPTLEDSSRIIR